MTRSDARPPRTAPGGDDGPHPEGLPTQALPGAPNGKVQAGEANEAGNEAQRSVFADRLALQADLALHEHLLWSRAELPNRLIEMSLDPDEGLAETFRLDAMYQFCEFFYLLKARGIESVESIARLAEIHNLHLDALTRDAEKMRRLGLRKERLLDAIFTADTLPRLLDSWREHPGRLDQSNLARLLVTVMSSETCRKLVVASAEAGFLHRSRSPWGTVLVTSSGLIEEAFGRLMRDLRLRIAGTTAPHQEMPT